MRLRSLLAAGSLLFAGIAAHADPLTGVFNVTVSEGLTNGNGFDTANGNPFTVGAANTASATFTYTGALNFSNLAAQNPPGHTGDTNGAFFTSGVFTNYNGSGRVDTTPGDNTTLVANYNSLAQFLNSSGSSSGFTYGSYYTFDLGTLYAGTTLTITHDDGASVFEDGKQVGTTVSGPTGAVTDVVSITKPKGDVVIRYARENGTPSILQVTAATPEPSSVALLGTGLLGVAGALRRRMRK